MSTALSKHWSRLLGTGHPCLGQAPSGGATSRHGGPPEAVRVAAGCVDAAHSDRVSRLWALVQTELGLPAPAISVDGRSGWQIWFALAQPHPRDEVERVLQRLLEELLDDPGAEVTVQALPAEAMAESPPVPRQVGPDRWSAFVAPDLVPVFADSPWLDCAPGEEGQAALLARLTPIEAPDWARLVAAASKPPEPFAEPDGAAGPTAVAPTPVAASSGVAVPSAVPSEGAANPATGEARAFLLAVMKDPGVEMALRIEAARALLAHG